MLFSSHIFILLFLPLTLCGYFLLNRLKSGTPARVFLLAANMLFYSWFNWSYFSLLAGSIVINFLLGRRIYDLPAGFRRKLLLLAGLVFNLGLLGYYKYYNFFMENINTLFSLDQVTEKLLLPLGISFFTFQQLAYLVGIYKGEHKDRYSLLTYAIFVSFFPQLIAGPIVLPEEMMPQFDDPKNRHWNSANFALGLWIFSLGLAKKILLADYIATFTDPMYAGVSAGLDMAECWKAALGFSFQIYFDFSGYCDMAIGLGYMFNIKLPINFSSPYKSASMKEFWQSWHITLGRFLAVFVYFPLGGSKKSPVRTCVNLMVTFLVSGLWHGAGWLYIAWGGLYGVATVVHFWWRKFSKAPLPRTLGIAITFFFIVVFGVVFRSSSWTQVGNLLSGMFNFSYASLADSFNHFSRNTLFALLLSAGIVFFCENTMELAGKFKPTLFRALVSAGLIVCSIFCMARLSPFLYFNF